MLTRRCIQNQLLRLGIVLLVFGVGVGVAATTLKIAVQPGVTLLQVEGIDIEVETTASVVVYLSVVDGEVSGSVEPAPGVRSSTVTITVLGSPETVIYKGRVTSPVDFTEYIFTQETGRGEQ